MINVILMNIVTLFKLIRYKVLKNELHALVISAESVVSGFIPGYSVAVRNPARVVINRKKSQIYQQSQERGVIF